MTKSKDKKVLFLVFLQICDHCFNPQTAKYVSLHFSCILSILQFLSQFLFFFSGFRRSLIVLYTKLGEEGAKFLAYKCTGFVLGVSSFRSELNYQLKDPEFLRGNVLVSFCAAKQHCEMQVGALRVKEIMLLVKIRLMQIILELKVFMSQIMTKKLCFEYFYRFVTLALLKLKLLVKMVLSQIYLELKITTNQVTTKKNCFGYFCRFVTRALTFRLQNTGIWISRAFFVCFAVLKSLFDFFKSYK